MLKKYITRVFRFVFIGCLLVAKSRKHFDSGLAVRPRDNLRLAESSSKLIVNLRLICCDTLLTVKLEQKQSIYYTVFALVCVCVFVLF